MDNIQARINFVDKVMKGQYSRAEAEAELDRMEQEFGNAPLPLGKLPAIQAVVDGGPEGSGARFYGQRQLPQIL